MHGEVSRQGQPTITPMRGAGRSFWLLHGRRCAHGLAPRNRGTGAGWGQDGGGGAAQAVHPQTEEEAPSSHSVFLTPKPCVVPADQGKTWLIFLGFVCFHDKQAAKGESAACMGHSLARSPEHPPPAGLWPRPHSQLSSLGHDLTNSVVLPAALELNAGRGQSVPHVRTCAGSALQARARGGCGFWGLLLKMRTLRLMAPTSRTEVLF